MCVQSRALRMCFAVTFTAANSVVIIGDREEYSRESTTARLLDQSVSGRFWTSVLVEPPVPEGSGETYVEWKIESSTSEPVHVLIGVCGAEAAEAVRSIGSIAWKQEDAFMYYLESGFKYSGGLSLDFAAGISCGPRVRGGDTVGLLVETYPMSKSNSSGRRLSLYVNGKCAGQLFSERGLSRGEAGNGPAEWPERLWFAVDVLTPSVKVCLRREKTFHSKVLNFRFRNVTWDVYNKTWRLV
jgi:hypothetical protein